MAATFNSIMARPVPVVAGLLVLGAVLAFVELGTVAAVAFMLAGLVMMFAYGRNTKVGANSDQAASPDRSVV